jgi:hypothetical protein
MLVVISVICKYELGLGMGWCVRIGCSVPKTDELQGLKEGRKEGYITMYASKGI